MSAAKSRVEVEQRISIQPLDLVLSERSTDSQNLNLEDKMKDLMDNNPFDLVGDSRLDLDELDLGGDLLSKEDSDLLALSA